MDSGVVLLAQRRVCFRIVKIRNDHSKTELVNYKAQNGENMKKIMAIDGNSILNRAFYGVKPLTNKNGLQTGAVFGMLNIILSQIERIEPDGVVVAFDLKAPTFRHLMYDKYKSNRHGMPDELAAQLPYAKQVLSAMGFNVVTKEGYEADDILGSVAAIARDGGAEAYLLSGDRDLLQLITEGTKILLAGNNETKLYGREEFFEKYGIMPESFVELKALMGDSSDCIPGVAGVGEKTALKLMLQYGSLDGIFEALDKMDPKASLTKKLEAGRESAYLSKELATICTNAPIGLGFEDLALKKRDDNKLLQIFTELEFSSFIKKLELETSFEAAKDDTDNKTVERISVSPDRLIAIKDELFGFVGENFSSFFDGKVIYECEYLSLGDISEFFTPERKLTVFDSKKLYKTLFEMGIWNFSVNFDVMLAAYTVNSANSEPTFESVCLAYLGSASKDGDAEALYRVSMLLKERIKNDGLSKVYDELELPLSYLLAKMETRGFKVEKQGLEDYSETLLEGIERLSLEIYSLAGVQFNINSPKQLGEVLFEGLSLPAGKKTKSGYSTGAEVLEKLRPYHPIIDKILEYRKLTKLRATYTEGLLRVADDRGMVHTEFKQTGTVTGRLSSAEPNLQNIPVRTKEGRELRRFFVPSREDRVLIDADYSQIELRVLAHLSGDENMISAFREGGDIHTKTASQVFGVSPEEVTPELRKRAKAVNFGIIYGMSDFTLAVDLGITRAQASSYIDNYFATYPKIEKYLKSCIEGATQTGYTTTIFGRRRYIPELQAGKARLKSFGERVAMNSPIQGSAADIIKLAMINTQKALDDAKIDAEFALQVHDELIIDSSKKDCETASRILKEQMENVLALSVDLTVDLNIGSTWYECK